MPLHTLLEPPAPPLVAGRLRAHLGLMRLDHSVKQIFVTPGILLAMVLTNTHLSAALTLRFVLGLIALTLVASSNYVLNELLDAPFDRMHPTKCHRPAACGRINQRVAWLQWLVLGSAGLALASTIAPGLLFSCLALWIMGCVYNIAPVRTKDLPYVDVLSESINNPLRFLAGWYMVTAILTPPMSMLVSYWMIGAYFMSLKRFSEYREIGPEVARLYRRSFEVYTQKSLLNSVVFYGSASMLFFGAFIMRYRLELVFAFPVIALLMAVYFDMAFEPGSAVQNPEKLFREPRLMTLLVACIALLLVLLYVQMPWLQAAFPKSTS